MKYTSQKCDRSSTEQYVVIILALILVLTKDNMQHVDDILCIDNPKSHPSLQNRMQHLVCWCLCNIMETTEYYHTNMFLSVSTTHLNQIWIVMAWHEACNLTNIWCWCAKAVISRKSWCTTTQSWMNTSKINININISQKATYRLCDVVEFLR